MQLERARQRMMQEVPKADVVVTNPTHVAVALRYDADHMEAPRVVAKGADLLAQHIMTLAQAHHVVLVRSPRLARVLYSQVSLRQEIPVALFVAVAQVLAYVYTLRRQGESQGELDLEEGVLPMSFTQAGNNG
jgi:flagellar biosynthetic protein FlhB